MGEPVDDTLAETRASVPDGVGDIDTDDESDTFDVAVPVEPGERVGAALVRLTREAHRVV